MNLSISNLPCSHDTQNMRRKKKTVTEDSFLLLCLFFSVEKVQVTNKTRPKQTQNQQQKSILIMLGRRPKQIRYFPLKSRNTRCAEIIGINFRSFLAQRPVAQDSSSAFLPSFFFWGGGGLLFFGGGGGGGETNCGCHHFQFPF